MPFVYCAPFFDSQKGCAVVSYMLHDAGYAVHLYYALHGKWFPFLLGTVKL